MHSLKYSRALNDLRHLSKTESNNIFYMLILINHTAKALILALFDGYLKSCDALTPLVPIFNEYVYLIMLLLIH